MMDDATEGTVYELGTGRRVGRSRDIEGEFVAAVQQCIADGEDVVVYTSASVPWEFVERLQRECEVDVEVHADLPDGVSVIVQR